MRVTQKQKVRSKLLEDGEITNHWCIEQKLTTRLGAIIHILRLEGMEIEGGFIEGSKNFRYYLPSGPKKKLVPEVVFRDGQRFVRMVEAS